MADNRLVLALYPRLDLSRSEIRLLRLQPGPKHLLCRCELFTSGFEDIPSYRALSYAWGNPWDTEDIIVQGRVFRVTTSLATALRQLRRTSVPILLWVDAICIDQTNRDERSNQVQLMRQIYQNAQEVVIWLGNELGGYGHSRLVLKGDYRDSANVESFVHQFSENSAAGRPSDCVLSSFCLLWMLAQGRHLTGNPLFTVQTVTSLNGLLALPWFTRMWVLQESVVARRATVLLGSVAAPFSMFAKAAQSYESHRSSCCPLFATRGDLSETALAYNLALQTRVVLEIQECRSAWTRGSRTTLFPLLWQFHGRKATDARDKVFALLGLVTNWGNCEPLKPDYTKQYSDIYRDVVLHMICVLQSLDCLIGRSPLDGVSWIPRWTLDVADRNAERLNLLEHYDATPGSKPVVEVHGDVFIIDCVGTDRIIQISDELPSGHTTHATASRWYQPQIRHWFEPEDKRTLGTENSTSSAPDGNAWRLLCGDSVAVVAGRGAVRRALDSDSDLFDSWWLSIKALARSAMNPGHYGFDEDLGRFDRAVRAATAGRRFFRTQNGLTGIGPANTKVGDEICVPLGSRTPFVIRLANLRSDVLGCSHGTCQRFEVTRFAPWEHLDISLHDTHKLIGDCYVHELMDGQAYTRGSFKNHMVYLV